MLGIILGLILVGLSFLFWGNFNLLLFLMGLGIGIGVLPFIIDIAFESRRNTEIDEMFLEFSRNLAESVKTGTPVSKSIINLASRSYGALSPYVAKLANQISIGIPVNKSLETFAYEIDNPVVTRAVTLIREAEKAGGDIENILESSAQSIAEIEKLRKERTAAISSIIAQGYIIFFIFIAIMLVMEFKIMPITQGLGGLGLDLSGNINAQNLNSQTVDLKAAAAKASAEQNSTISPFLVLLLVQGFFCGLIIGKISTGNIRGGLRHSFVLMMSAFLISTVSKLIWHY